jgi:hypothetical protein
MGTAILKKRKSRPERAEGRHSSTFTGFYLMMRIAASLYNGGLINYTFYRRLMENEKPADGSPCSSRGGLTPTGAAAPHYRDYPPSQK